MAGIVCPDYERGDKIGFSLHDVDISESFSIGPPCSDSDFQAVGMATRHEDVDNPSSCLV